MGIENWHMASLPSGFKAPLDSWRRADFALVVRHVVGGFRPRSPEAMGRGNPHCGLERIAGSGPPATAYFTSGSPVNSSA